MSNGPLTYPQYFNAPFAVRNANGQALLSETGTTSICTKVRQLADVSDDTGLVHQQQRRQRRSGHGHPVSHETNLELRNQHIPTMDVTSPTSMLKRKRSGNNALSSSSKQLRTLSEPHLHMPLYPFNRQPTQWNDVAEHKATEGRISPARMNPLQSTQWNDASGDEGAEQIQTNPLFFRVHQTPEAFSHDIQKVSYFPQLTPTRVVAGDLDEHGQIQQMPIHVDQPLEPLLRRSSGHSPPRSNLEHAENSQEALRSVETPTSSGTSLNGYNHIFDRSRGPSFSPITIYRSSPDLAASDVACSPTGIHKPDNSQGVSNIHAYDSHLSHVSISHEALSTSHLPSEAPDWIPDLDQVHDHSTALHFADTHETTTDSYQTNICRPAERMRNLSLSHQTEAQSASGVVSDATDKNLGVVRLRFNDKAALGNAINKSQRSRRTSAQKAVMLENRMGRGQSAKELSGSTATTEAVQAYDSTDDQRFVEEVKIALERQGNRKTANVARRSARRIRQLLEISKPPNTTEALFLSGHEAAKLLERGSFFEGPIITQGQQPLPLQTSQQFLDEYYDDEAEVWIQDPAILLARNVPHAREITIGKLKERFKEGTSSSKAPWNCLEMATHVEDGLRPAFLNNEDCRLLTKLKLPGSADSASRRGYEPGWKEVEKWALLAQGGALTEPHQDSHGYGTYITLNQGAMGFGWLSNPTAEERSAWRDKPATYVGGRWRYVVLRPGQTVYFPSGTVHFVFRLAKVGDTLAFGGHVLRCSQIVRWVETILQEFFGPDITNEELSVSAPAYLDRVERFVKQALNNGEVERWGGADAIDRFLKLKEEYDVLSMEKQEQKA